MDDIAFIALGSNLGDRQQHLRDALRRIADIPDAHFIAESSVEETQPVGPVAQGAFLNQMVAIRTSLTPPELLAVLHAAEAEGGRVRSTRWGPRTIDLDIVKYARTTWNSPELQVPHSEIDNREFWQRELAELEEVMI
ncbi:MAG: 2-amino-4-hydroxy-6-hydroxymethyldihydropteridine diphosphokinase [Gemmatimonadaceae bacterium]